MTPLYTFGYEGTDLARFIARLKGAGVQVVVDVRELPLSRKRGFSKRAFAAALSGAEIDYVHVPALGCPKPVRSRLKANGNWAAYCRDFEAHLRKQRAAVVDLVSLARKATTCLVCFEADFNFCHRTLVARAAAQLSAIPVKHLTLETAIADVSRRAAA